jgi:signal transduction histidine kinase
VIAVARAAGSTPVELETDDRLPELRGDPMLLREALVNLVTNAVEACAGGGRVSVTAIVRPVGSAPVLEIAVRDTGPGIPERELARVTAPGYTTKESGSGLGLAVAERVVAAHRGRLLIDSEVGRGTTVTALLPFDLPGVGYPE